MQKLVDKFGLYTQHIQNVIADTSKKLDRATLQGKYNKLIDAKVLLRGSLLIDILAEAKKFSLTSQKNDISIIDIVECVETTKWKYKRLLKKLEGNENYVFELPTLKSVITEIEGNEDGEPLFQNQKVHYYSREKQYIKDHVVQVVENIISCFEQRYGNLYIDQFDGGVNEVSDDGDNVLFDVCRVLNSQVWPNILNVDDETVEEILLVQLAAVQKIFERYSSMEVFTVFNLNNVKDGFIDIVRYSNRYFNITETKPLLLWGKLAKLGEEKPDWRGILLIIELCLCAPFSNATLERFFSHMNIVKSEERNRLSSKSLNAILRVRMSDFTVVKFNSLHVNECVDFWYNTKDRRLNQKKRKCYQKRKCDGNKRIRFDISDISTSSSSDSEISESDV